MAERRIGLPADPTDALAPMRLRALDGAAGMVAAVRAALDRGILEALRDGAGTPNAIADRCDLTTEVLDVVLRQLQLAEVCERDEAGRLRLVATPEGVRWTVERWDRLGGVIGGDQPTSTQHLYPLVGPLLAARQRPEAVRAASLLATPGMHLLDLGGGASPVGQAIVAADPSARVTVVDRAPVLDAIQPLLSPHTEDRAASGFRLVAADITSDPLPGDADVVLLAGVLHLFDEPSIVSLLRRAEQCASPGGRIAIIEPLLADTHEVDPMVTSYELDLFLRQPQGGIWPYSRLAGFCARAGLRHLRRFSLGGPMNLVTGEAGPT